MFGLITTTLAAVPAALPMDINIDPTTRDCPASRSCATSSARL